MSNSGQKLITNRDHVRKADIEFTNDNNTESHRIDRLQDAALVWYTMTKRHMASEQLKTSLVMPVKMHDWKGELQLFYSDYEPSDLEVDTWREVWELFRECKENVKFYIQKVETYELN